MCSRTRENNKNKAGPVIWDTLYKHLKPHKVKKDILWNANMHFHINTTSAKSDLNAFTEILCNHVSPQQFWPRTQK